MCCNVLDENSGTWESIVKNPKRVDSRDINLCTQVTY